MSCILNTGVALGCRDEKSGGVFALYLASYSASTIFSENGSGVVTGATAYNTFYEFQFPAETAEISETGNFSVENQTAYFEQVINSAMYSTDQTTRDALNLLGMGRVFAIAKDNTGKYFLYFRQNGGWLTSATILLGKAMGDMNGIQYTLTGKNTVPAVECHQSLLTTLGF